MCRVKRIVNMGGHKLIAAIATLLSVSVEKGNGVITIFIMPSMTHN